LKKNKNNNEMVVSYNKDGYLTGKMLAAMPFLQGDDLHHSVIFLCGHDNLGAIGLIINKYMPELTFKDIADQLKLQVDVDRDVAKVPINFGGEDSKGKGFVLHSSDYKIESTLLIDKNICVTTTLEILRAIALGGGPKDYIVCFGHTVWDSGQLETELLNNQWMVVDADYDVIFRSLHEKKWLHSMKTIGIEPSYLVSGVGHA